jgi:predicted neuraminidase
MRDAKEFEAQVEAAGGRVRFLFGTEAPFAQCHAPTIVEARDGTLLAAWFGGTREKHPDVAIWLAHGDAHSWSSPRRIAKLGDTAHWNPVLFRDADDVLHLFFKIGAEIATWQTYWMHSRNDGVHWSDPAELVPGDRGGRGPVRAKPIIVADGAWLAGASIEHSGWTPFADRSHDRGHTWQRSADWSVAPGLIDAGAIQPVLWERASGHVVALLRTRAGRVWRTESVDHGVTWAPMTATPIPNNNSAIDALRLPSGIVLLAHNPTGTNWGPRTPLTLSVVSDDGRDWTPVAQLDDAPDGEFSYPALVATRTGIAVAYTWRRERIRCWEIPYDIAERLGSTGPS